MLSQNNVLKELALSIANFYEHIIINYLHLLFNLMLITTIARILQALQHAFLYANAYIHVIAQSREHMRVHPLLLWKG